MKLETASVGIAAERFRLATGKFPELVDELVPEYLDHAPIDAAGNQSVLLAPTERGINALSFGFDFFDDKGAATEPRASNVQFRLLNPRNRGLVLTDDPSSDGG